MNEGINKKQQKEKSLVNNRNNYHVSSLSHRNNILKGSYIKSDDVAGLSLNS